MKRCVLFAFIISTLFPFCTKNAGPDPSIAAEDSLIKIRTFTVDEHVLHRAYVAATFLTTVVKTSLKEAFVGQLRAIQQRAIQLPEVAKEPAPSGCILTI